MRTGTRGSLIPCLLCLCLLSEGTAVWADEGRPADPSVTPAIATAPDRAGNYIFPPKGENSFGYTDSAYRVRFTTVNRTADQASWILRINYSWFRSVQLYDPAAGTGSAAGTGVSAGPEAGYAMRETGYRLPISTRDIKARQFLFELYIPPGESETYYIRFKTTDLMILDLTISSARAYLAEDHESQLCTGSSSESSSS